MKRWMTAALVVLATATGAAGQECEAGVEGCFQFWTGCTPIWVSVSIDENTIGVRQANAEDAVESRLRAAGLYTEDPPPAGELALSVDFTDSGAVNIVLEFIKFVRDDYGFRWPATTWQRNPFGTARRASEVMEAVRQRLDEFMNEFLRVNAPACAAR